MKKIASIIFSTAILLMFFTSCDDKEKADSNSTNPIVGYWILKSDTQMPHIEKYFPHTGDNFYNYKAVYQFTEDGKFNFTYTDSEDTEYKASLDYQTENSTLTLLHIDISRIFFDLTQEEELWAGDERVDYICELSGFSKDRESESYEFNIEKNTLTLTKNDDNGTRTQVLCKCSSDGTLL